MRREEVGGHQGTVKHQSSKAMRRVRSDRGEEYRSATAAAKAMGLSPGAVNEALRYGHQAGGRRWHVVPTNYTHRHITAVQPSQLPTEIVNAALLLTNFFEARGDSYWKYMGLASRTALEDCESRIQELQS